MIIVWSSSANGPYALLIPIALVVVSAFVDDFQLLLQGVRAGVYGAVCAVAVLATFAVACKVFCPRIWAHLKQQCTALCARIAAAAQPPPRRRVTSRLSTGGQAPRQPGLFSTAHRQQDADPAGPTSTPDRQRGNPRMQTGGRAPCRTPSQRFTEVARAVQQLPAQLYVSEQDLQAKSAHELKDIMRQRGLPWRQGEAMDKGDAIQHILEASNSSSQSCPVCCEDYKQGDVLRELRCRHTFHLECIDRWCLASADRSNMPACPMCNESLC